MGHFLSLVLFWLLIMGLIGLALFIVSRVGAKKNEEKTEKTEETQDIADE